jgi:protein associated with RNAse G/E
MSGNGISVAVKGIYSTAIAKILVDNGFLIVNSSVNLQERLGLENFEIPPDISIMNKRDFHGIHVRNLSEDPLILERFMGVMSDTLPFSIFFTPGRNIVDIDFPLPVKRLLDGLRSQLLHTIEDHHYFKVFGGHVASMVDMAERLLMKGESYAEVYSKFLDLVLPFLPYEDTKVDVKHVKLSGSTLNLGRATVVSYLNEKILYRRKIRSNGVYDGLEVKRDAGDVAASETRSGEYFIETRYYSHKGKLKGTYFNINTPVEVYTSEVRYIDLELDVVLFPDGSYKLLDLDKLEKAENKGTITMSMGMKARETADFLIGRFSRVS